MMHVLDSAWDGTHSRLIVAQRTEDGDATEVTALEPEGAFRWTVSEERICVGRWEEGAYIPCPEQRPVSSDSVCGRCAPEWAACIFEPRLHGDHDDCPLCQREHVVYIAWYGGLPKVGLTQRRRLLTRLREQGADAGFVLASTQKDGTPLDRRGARDTEQSVSFLHGIPQWRRHKETLPQLTRPIDWGLIENRAKSLMEELADRWPVEQELLRIDEVPLPVPLPSVPERRATVGDHSGTWLGAKGTHWFYSPDAAPGRLDVGFSPVLALKRSDLVGRYITLDA